MRLLILGALVAGIAGCSTTGLESGSPSALIDSSKGAKQFSQCLAPKWQALNPSTTVLDGESEYRVTASGAFTGAVALAVVRGAANGSTARVYLPMDWAGTKGWIDAAKSCR